MDSATFRLLPSEPCVTCGVEIVWDEETETYEAADGSFLCPATTDHYEGHNPA